jgi:hypothetical protein
MDIYFRRGWHHARFRFDEMGYDDTYKGYNEVMGDICGAA